jgi:hypothetical protein
MLLVRPRFEGKMVRNRYNPKFAVCDLSEDKRPATAFWILRSGFTDVEVVHSIPRQDCVNVFALFGGAGPRQNDSLCIDQIGNMRGQVIPRLNFL